ncbi:hypothetical protein GN956_G15722 [Arapaima gigas]
MYFHCIQRSPHHLRVREGAESHQRELDNWLGGVSHENGAEKLFPLSAAECVLYTPPVTDQCHSIHESPTGTRLHRLPCFGIKIFYMSSNLFPVDVSKVDGCSKSSN